MSAVRETPIALAEIARLLPHFDRSQRWWAMPIVAAFELQSPGRALTWTDELLALGAVTSGHALRDEWFSDIANWPALTTESAFAASQATWDDDRGRDEWQTAMSRLYAAAGLKLCGDEPAYRREIANALAVVADSIMNLPLPQVTG